MDIEQENSIKENNQILSNSQKGRINSALESKEKNSD